MSNNGKSLKFEITIEKNGDGAFQVNISTQVCTEDGTSESKGTHSFLLSKNHDIAQKMLSGRVGHSISELFVDSML